ncbi:MAG: ADOP family duplicated permease [Terriglobales bacterium]
MGLRRHGAAALVVFNLALGLGANIAIFSVADAVLFRPLPFPAPRQLVAPQNGYYPKGYIVGLQRRVRALSLAAFSAGESLNLEQRGHAISLHGSAVSTNFFALLGVNPALGGGFGKGEDQPGQDGVVVISAALWRERFAGRRDIIGEDIALGGREHRVVGVMPPDFAFPTAETQFWIPMRLDPSQFQDYWETYSFEAVGRMRPGVSLGAARADFHRAAVAAVSDFPYPVPASYANQYPLVGLRTDLLGSVQTTLLLILGAVGLVLLIGCANAANLLLTQFTALRRDTAMRLALGAGQGRMLVWFLVRAVRLALLGGALGLLLAFWTLPLLARWLPAAATSASPVALDWTALGFAFALSLAAGLVTGAVPGWRASHVNLAREMRASTAGRAPGRMPFPSLLLMVEIALAVVVVIAGVLLAQSLRTLSRQNPGFQADAVSVVRIHPSAAYCAVAGRCAEFYRQLQADISALPGVRFAAVVNSAPLEGIPSIAAVVFENHPLLPGKQVPLVWANLITPGYLRTAGVALVAGRGFAASDSESSQHVALISVGLARTLWPHASPLGKQVTALTTGLKSWTIVGEVADVREFRLRGNPGIYRGEVYFPIAQALTSPPLAGSLDDMSLLLRSPAPPSAATLRRTILALNPDVAVDPPRALEAIVFASVAGPRTTTRLFELFALLALVLSMLGVYAVVGEAVAQRGREFGVRMALGARPGSVEWLVLRRCLALAGGGISLGLLAAWMLNHLLAGLLFRVSPVDPVLYAAAAALVVVAMMLAAYRPARRARRTDPSVVLRSE